MEFERLWTGLTHFLNAKKKEHKTALKQILSLRLQYHIFDLAQLDKLGSSYWG